MYFLTRTSVQEKRWWIQLTIHIKRDGGYSQLSTSKEVVDTVNYPHQKRWWIQLTIHIKRGGGYS
jgi:hypothetical protein